MAEVTGAFPYDPANLLGGRARILFAPTSEAIPDNLVDVIDLTSPYAPNGSWEDLGAAVDSSSYSRDMDSEGYEIQQVSGNIFEEITEITRTMNVDIAEIVGENVRLIEEAAAPSAIAAAANQSAQEALKFGSFSETTRYRFCLIAQRQKASGIVTEPGGATRGRFVAVVLYNAGISADEAEFEFEKGELVHAPVELTAYPEAGQTAGQEYGSWFFEDAGTIAS